MRYLRTNTACRVTVGPFLSATDGVTPRTALTATNEHLTFIVDDGNVPTLVLDANATASAGNNNMVHVTNDDAGFYDLELTAAQTNYLGRAMLSINYVTDHCPVFHEFMILPAVIYDAMILGTDLFDVSMTQILGTAVSSPATAGILDVNLKNIANAAVSTTTAQLGVNVVQISADATAADNAESFFDGTGYAGTNNVIPTVTTVGTATNLTNLPAAAATAAELAKVPKSDSNVTFNATALASINSQVVDALNTDTYAEPGQGAPAATASIVAKLGYLYKSWRNKKEQTSSQFSLYADDGTTLDQKAAVSDDGTTTTKGEMATGA